MNEDFYDDARTRAALGGRKIERDYTDEELVKIANDNHIWLNAFECIRPSDDFLKDVGRMVVAKLMESKIRNDFTGLTPVAFLRLNAS